MIDIGEHRAMSLSEKRKELSTLLLRIVVNDTNYDLRYDLIMKAMALAIECLYKVGIRVDTSNNWPVCVIHLPTGQVSWHMPPDETCYDNHTTEEKIKRIDDFCVYMSTL